MLALHAPLVKYSPRECKMKFFISYSHADKEIALDIRRVCEKLEVSCFLDEKDISWGQSVTGAIAHGLRDCTHLIVVLSPASLKSAWVSYEVGRATERGMTILPFLTHPSIDLPGFFPDARRVSSIDELRKQVEIFSESVQDLARSLIQKFERLPSMIRQ